MLWAMQLRPPSLTNTVKVGHQLEVSGSLVATVGTVSEAVVRMPAPLRRLHAQIIAGIVFGSVSGPGAPLSIDVADFRAHRNGGHFRGLRTAFQYLLEHRVLRRDDGR